MGGGETGESACFPFLIDVDRTGTVKIAEASADNADVHAQNNKMEQNFPFIILSNLSKRVEDWRLATRLIWLSTVSQLSCSARPHQYLTSEML